MKYLELIKGQFTADHEARAKQQEPYVAYSEEAGGVMYTFIPAPVVGPADNEIWYTTVDGEFIEWTDPYCVIPGVDDEIINLRNSVTHKYENNTIISTFASNNNYPIYIGFMFMSETINSSDKERLVTLHIPSTFSIGTDTFGHCPNLKNVTLDGPCGIFNGGFSGQSYFEGCTSLESFTIPLNSTVIPYACFSGCSSLTSITIPESVTSIRRDAFNNTGIYNDESNWENNVLYIDNCLISAKESISGSYTIKENTRLIADWAFEDCKSLTSVTIPNRVTSIGDYVFYGCKGLTSITIPNSVTSIGYSAFSDCYALTSVTIPNSVTSIGDYVFYGCKGLTSITFEGTMEQWNAVEKYDFWNKNVPATYVQCTDGQVAL